MKKIYGSTVGMGLPKPDLTQTDPEKGNYVKGKEEFTKNLPAGPKGDPGKDGVTPHIGSNGHWYIGTTDTGIKAQGEPGKDGDDGVTPHIGANGNWYIGTTDTGVKAQGEPGKDGDDGVTPHIGANGNWYIGTTDTGIKAQGEPGVTPVKGTDYFTAADKSELVAAVIAALPDASEVSY